MPSYACKKNIRREFALDEGDIKNMEAVKKSLQKLQQLGYFKVGEEPFFFVRYHDHRDLHSFPTRRSSDLDVHVVIDNYATHKTAMIRKWLAKRPRWHVHLTPTSASWLNQVERFFALLTDKKIRRGIHRSVAALKADIAAFIRQHNARPKPFRWTKSADDILASVERFCQYNAPAKV